MVTSSLIRLGEVAEVYAGIPGFGDEGEYSYQVLLPNSFTDTGEISFVEIQNKHEEISRQQMLRQDDILVKRLNPSFVHIVSDKTAGMVASQNLLVVRPLKAVYPFYLGYLLEQKEIIGQILQVTGSAAPIKAISIKKLADTMIPIVPREKQIKIGGLWRLSRQRKQLLHEYIDENDKFVSALTSHIIGNGGLRK